MGDSLIPLTAVVLLPSSIQVFGIMKKYKTFGHCIEYIRLYIYIG
jgi:hypothetical protein